MDAYVNIIDKNGWTLINHDALDGELWAISTLIERWAHQ